MEIFLVGELCTKFAAKVQSKSFFIVSVSSHKLLLACKYLFLFASVSTQRRTTAHRQRDRSTCVRARACPRVCVCACAFSTPKNIRTPCNARWGSLLKKCCDRYCVLLVPRIVFEIQPKTNSSTTTVSTKIDTFLWIIHWKEWKYLAASVPL